MPSPSKPNDLRKPCHSPTRYVLLLSPLQTGEKDCLVKLSSLPEVTCLVSALVPDLHRCAAAQTPPVAPLVPLLESKPIFLACIKDPQQQGLVLRPHLFLPILLGHSPCSTRPVGLFLSLCGQTYASCRGPRPRSSPQRASLPSAPPPTHPCSTFCP